MPNGLLTTYQDIEWGDTLNPSDSPGGPNPDWDSAPNVIAYRMQQVEHKLINIDHKLDTMASQYVTLQMLQLTLDPLKAEIGDLKAEAKADEVARKASMAQLKLALTIAVLSPVLNIIITIMLDRSK